MAGFSGVQNFPTVGLIDGLFRQNLEETDMGYGLEVDMIRLAHELGLLTTPYAFNDDEATAMAKAGADILIPHMGLTTKGSIGAKTALTLEDAVKRVQAMHDAAKKVNKDILVLCHGGPISEPEDAQYVLDRTQGIVGFYGASSIERLPTEVAITSCVKKFKTMRSFDGLPCSRLRSGNASELGTALRRGALHPPHPQPLNEDRGSNPSETTCVTRGV